MFAAIDISNITLAEILTLSGTLATLIVGFVKKNDWTIPFLGWIGAKISKLCPWNRHSSKLDAILKELKPNGGESLRDAINRIEKHQKMQSNEFQLLKKRSETRDEINLIANFETDKNGECVWANKHYLNIVGLTLPEVLGNGWANAIADKDREYVFKEWNAAIEYKRDFHLKFHYKNNKDDTTFPVKVDALLVTNNIGEVVGWLGYVKVLPDLSSTQKI